MEFRILEPGGPQFRSPGRVLNPESAKIRRRGTLAYVHYKAQVIPDCLTFVRSSTLRATNSYQQANNPRGDVNWPPGPSPSLVFPARTLRKRCPTAYSLAGILTRLLRRVSYEYLYIYIHSLFSWDSWDQPSPAQPSPAQRSPAQPSVRTRTIVLSGIPQVAQPHGEGCNLFRKRIGN